MAARLVAFIVLLLAATASAGAEPLQRLHVLTFSLVSDAQRPSVGVPFDVTITIRVAENVPHIDNVYLPTFAGPEELGDERQLYHSRGGTVYRETMRLVAHSRGPLSIGSAYLDAIDARDGKPKRFISNVLQLSVRGGPAFDLWRPLRVLAEILAATAFAIALLALLVRAVRGALARPAPAMPAPEPPPVPDPAPPSIEDEFNALRARRDRAAVLGLRSALWRAAGAGEGQTLSDIFARGRAVDERRRRILLLVERAAFIEDDRLADAVDDVLAEAEGSLA